ncbi:DNA ligase [Frankliniella fusca]|uniref:DNA ligase n=1 Tax=Frankliniella fusca TaxID=407009 RepID=A0AAE1I2T6_9NEOP|nr:DNA ligase [Frankliniella fusca]
MLVFIPTMNYFSSLIVLFGEHLTNFGCFHSKSITQLISGVFNLSKTLNKFCASFHSKSPSLVVDRVGSRQLALLYAPQQSDPSGRAEEGPSTRDEQGPSVPGKTSPAHTNCDEI